MTDLFDSTPPVFVDELMPCAPNRNWRYSESCDLFVDPEAGVEVLHAFAARIGLRRAWFQNKPGSMPHYDLTKARRLVAKRMGAVTLTRNDTVAVLRKWQAKKGEA